METTGAAVKEEKITTEATKPKKKKGFWPAFINFLAMGGFLLVLIFIVGIAIAISVIFK